MNDEIGRPADAHERAEAARLARALADGRLSDESGADDALAVARLLDGLRERPADELAAARLRRELSTRVAVRVRARRAALASFAALAAALLVALGLVLARRPAPDTAVLVASREEAARAALARLARTRGATETAASRLAASRFESIVSTLEDARVEALRWTDASPSAPSSPSSPDASPTSPAGGVS